MAEPPTQPDLAVAEIETETEFYQGEIIAGTEIKHGTGTLVNKESMTKYVGSFDHDKKTGDGQLEWINPEEPYAEYMGGFSDGIFEGMGVLLFRDGSTYKGEFSKGEMREGLRTFKNGDEYCGAFIGGIYDGYGVLKLANGE